MSGTLYSVADPEGIASMARDVDTNVYNPFNTDSVMVVQDKGGDDRLKVHKVDGEVYVEFL